MLLQNVLNKKGIMLLFQNPVVQYQYREKAHEKFT